MEAPTAAAQKVLGMMTSLCLLTFFSPLLCLFFCLLMFLLFVEISLLVHLQTNSPNLNISSFTKALPAPTEKSQQLFRLHNNESRHPPSTITDNSPWLRS